MIAETEHGALTTTRAAQLARRIEHEKPAVRVDALHPGAFGWEIACHHIGWLGSFTVRSEADWLERKAVLDG